MVSLPWPGFNPGQGTEIPKDIRCREKKKKKTKLIHKSFFNKYVLSVSTLCLVLTVLGSGNTGISWREGIMKEGCPVICEEEGEGHRGCDLMQQAKGVSQCRKRCWWPKKDEH